MIYVEIKNATVNTRTNPPESATKWTIHEQQGWAHLYDRDGSKRPFPELINIRIDKPDQAYPLGVYMLQPQSIYKNRYNSLTLGNPVLLAVERKQQQAA